MNVSKHKGVFFLFALSLFPRYPIDGTSVCLEGGAEYVRQRSCLSKNTFYGWGQKGRFIYQKRYRSFGHIDRFYLTHGILSGSDPFADRVKIQYGEAEGESWLTYCCCVGNCQIIPLFGYGVYVRWEKRLKPFRCNLNTSVVYVPLGMRIDYFRSQYFSIGGQCKVDFMILTWWRYRHSMLPSTFHKLHNRAGVEVKGWLRYDCSPEWTVAFIPSFRYLHLHYSTGMAWTPEAKKLFSYGINFGVDYCY